MDRFGLWSVLAEAEWSLGFGNESSQGHYWCLENGIWHRLRSKGVSKLLQVLKGSLRTDIGLFLKMGVVRKSGFRMPLRNQLALVSKHRETSAPICWIRYRFCERGGVMMTLVLLRKTMISDLATWVVLPPWRVLISIKVINYCSRRWETLCGARDRISAGSRTMEVRQTE